FSSFFCSLISVMFFFSCAHFQAQKKDWDSWDIRLKSAMWNNKIPKLRWFYSELAESKMINPPPKKAP
ncbi:MAG: hypothetical protein JW931_09180, partial [Methanomicrobiaceae archaeon]|nr:hypothetical protein [Methanomicrobiaceae archaeon]